MAPFTKKARICEPHNARAHRKQVMPNRTAAAVGTNDEYWRFNRLSYAGFRLYLNEYQLALKPRSQTIILSGINPRRPLCSLSHKAIEPFRVRGIKYSGTGI